MKGLFRFMTHLCEQVLRKISNIHESNCVIVKINLGVFVIKICSNFKVRKVWEKERY